MTVPDYGNDPVLIVMRNPEDVKASLLKTFKIPEGVHDFEGFLDNFMPRYVDALKALRPKRSLTIHFDDLNEYECLETVQQFLMPGSPFDLERAILLIHCNIQTTCTELTQVFKMMADIEGYTYNEFIAKYDGRAPCLGLVQ